MTYNVGDILVGKGFMGKTEKTEKYVVKKVTAKTVFFSLIHCGKALDYTYRSKTYEDGQLRINFTPYSWIDLRKA
jgi:hypothetical protein